MLCLCRNTRCPVASMLHHSTLPTYCVVTYPYHLSCYSSFLLLLHYSTCCSNIRDGRCVSEMSDGGRRIDKWYRGWAALLPSHGRHCGRRERIGMDNVDMVLAVGALVIWGSMLIMTRAQAAWTFSLRIYETAGNKQILPSLLSLYAVFLYSNCVSCCYSIPFVSYDVWILCYYLLSRMMLFGHFL